MLDILFSVIGWHFLHEFLKLFFRSKVAETITSNINAVIIVLFLNVEWANIVYTISLGYFVQNAYAVTKEYNKMDQIIFIGHHIFSFLAIFVVATDLIHNSNEHFPIFRNVEYNELRDLLCFQK